MKIDTKIIRYNNCVMILTLQLSLMKTEFATIAILISDILSKWHQGDKGEEILNKYIKKIKKSGESGILIVSW